MTDVSALTDLPTPVYTDYLLSWRGTAPYRIALGSIAFKDAVNGAFTNHGGWGFAIDSDGGFFAGGAAVYGAGPSWRNLVASQGGWAIQNNAGRFNLLTGSNPGAAGNVISDMTVRMVVNETGNVGIGNNTPAVRLDVGTSSYKVARFGSGATSSPASFDAGEVITTTAVPPVSGMSFSGSDGRLLTIGVAPDNSVYLRANKLKFASTTNVGFATGGASTDGVTIDTANNISTNGAILQINAAKWLAQHDGTNAYVRANTGNMYMGAGGANIVVLSTTALSPVVDNSVSLGGSANRYTTVYAVTGSINTSDERYKNWRGDLSETELKAAKLISNEIGVYQWLDAVEEKGENARLHIGVRAQRVFKILEECGLDWRRYAWCCYDKWEDEFEPIFEYTTKYRTIPFEKEVESSIVDVEGNNIKKTEIVEEQVEYQEMVDTGEKRLVRPAGDRYGVRPDQLAMFLIAAQEQRLAALEAALA